MSNPIGTNYFQRADAALKPRIREFYGDVLGWELNEINQNLDIFSFSGEASYGVRYTSERESLLSDEQYRSSTWLSILSDARVELIERMKKFGVTELPEQSDENNYFFQAPGGQVYVVGPAG